MDINNSNNKSLENTLQTNNDNKYEGSIYESIKEESNTNYSDDKFYNTNEK